MERGLAIALTHSTPATAVIMVLLLLNSKSFGQTQAWSTAETKTAYIKLAEFCAGDLSESQMSKQLQIDDAKARAMVQELILDVRGMSNVDPELKEIASDVAESAEEMMNSLNIIERLPRPPSELLRLAKGLAYLAIGEFAAAVKHDETVNSQTADVQLELKRLIDAVTKNRAAMLMLPRIAKKLAGETETADAVITIDLDEPWGFLAPDRIRLSNSSGKILHNCTIVVTLFGQNGETRENVHFVKTWPRNKRFYGTYSGGTTILGRSVFRQTVTAIQRAAIVVYCDQFTSSRIDYYYAGSERDKDIQHVLDNSLKLDSGYRPFSKGLLSDDKRAIHLTLNGVQFLPAGVAVIRATDGNRNVELRSEFQIWRSGEKRWFELDRVDWDPSEWTLEMSFKGTNAKRTFRWTWTN